MMEKSMMPARSSDRRRQRGRAEARRTWKMRRHDGGGMTSCSGEKMASSSSLDGWTAVRLQQWRANGIVQRWDSSKA
ncbi:hypothetical protein Syun_003734 [Stephania yunnanensis]|uniref:Uncharacterized protein n=1 Tax=Stephania yunnanensis TaxID=152371 RepID=A0AAP0Q036_9MAGN